MSDPDRHLPTALLSGITGYIGMRLSLRLLREGYAVHGITRNLSNRSKLGAAADRITLHACEGGTDSLIGIVAAVKPDIVFHLAGVFIAPHKPADVLPLLQSNVVFGTQLLEAMHANGVQHFVNVGTWWQHYNDEPYNPVGLYAATRQAFQDIVEYYARATSLRAITLKIFETYGEDDPRPKLLSMFKQMVREPRPLEMSLGEQVVDFVHVDDVVEAFIVAAHRLDAGDVIGQEHYAVSTRTAMRLKDVAKLFEEAAGVTLPIRWGARDYRPREMMKMCRAGEWLPGWTPKVSISQGIRRLLETDI